MLVPKSVFSLSGCTDPSASRYALGAVQFSRNDEGQPRAVATDGRKLVVLGWQEPMPSDYPALPGVDAKARLAGHDAYLIQGKDCKEAGRCKLGLRSPKPILAYTVIDESATAGQLVTIAATDLSQQAVSHVPQIEGRFPHWEDCCPPHTGKSTHSVTVNADHLIAVLQTIAKHVQDHAGNTDVVLSLDARNPSVSGIVLTAKSDAGNTAYGVIMPMASGSDDSLDYPGGRYQGHDGPVWDAVEHSDRDYLRVAGEAQAALTAVVESRKPVDESVVDTEVEDLVATE